MHKTFYAPIIHLLQNKMEMILIKTIANKTYQILFSSFNYFLFTKTIDIDTTDRMKGIKFIHALKKSFWIAGIQKNVAFINTTIIYVVIATIYELYFSHGNYLGTRSLSIVYHKLRGEPLRIL